MNSLHPLMAAILAPWTPPPRTAEEEASWVAADLVEAAQRARPDYEQLRADRIERRDADTLRLLTISCMPGDRL